MAPCRVQVCCAVTEVGDTVAVVGAAPELGGWDVSKALHLTTSAELFPLWSGELPSQGAVPGSEFKIILVQPQGHVIWEPLPDNQNRCWPSATGAQTIKAKFGEPGEQADRDAGKQVKMKDVEDTTTSEGDKESEEDEEKSVPALPTKQASFSHESLLKENPGIIADFYEMESSQMGQGAFGSVCKAKHKHSNDVRAVKTVVCEDMLRSMPSLAKEIAINKSMDHPNIVHMFETFRDDSHVYFVMEICTGGELFDRIVKEGHLGESRAAMFSEQMLEAVCYMHGQGVCHRDLKPENFLLSGEEEEQLKLIDFGLSTKFSPGQTLKTCVGTAFYVAPEVLDRSYSEACDLWSLGTILFCLLTGHPPFYGQTDREVLARVKRGHYSLDGDEWAEISDNGKSFIQSLLEMTVSERLTAAKALHHAWIAERVHHAASPQAAQLSKGLMSRLKKFRMQNIFKKAALHVVASRLDDSETADLRQLFKHLDQDGDGVLSVDELSAALGRAEGVFEVPEVLHEMIMGADTNGTDNVEYTEFLAVATGHISHNDEHALRAAFDVFDKDNDGKVSKEELAGILEDPTAVNESFREVDLNGDGFIDYDEFVKMVTAS